jgi:hypothetical protein
MRFPRALSLDRRRRLTDWPFVEGGEDGGSWEGDMGRLEGEGDGGEFGCGCGETGGRIIVD